MFLTVNNKRRQQYAHLTLEAGAHTGRPSSFLRRQTVIVLGILLLLIGWLVGIFIIEIVGAILLTVGVLLLLFDGAGHAIGGRRWY
jgi:hypothetical protein